MGTYDINFDFSSIKSIDTENGRFYTIGDKKYPSVTTVLGQNNKEYLNEWINQVGKDKADKISKYAADRGSKIHDLAEKYLTTGKIEEKNLFYLTMFNHLKKWIDTNIQKVVLVEKPLFSHKLKMAGRVDCIGFVNDQLCIIDFKTSTKEKKKEWIENYYLQCTAYALFYREMFGVNIEKFYICIVEESSNVPNIFQGNPNNYVKKLIEVRKNYK